MVVQDELVRRIAENRRLIDDLIKPEVYPAVASPVPAPVALNDMLIADATPVWAILTGPAAQGEILVAGAAPFTQVWTTVDLLSLTHGDTTPQAVTRGSIIYGDAAPTWNELVIGPATNFLRSDGADIAWSPILVTDLPAHNLLSAQHGDTVVQGVTRGSIVYGDATPDWNELVIGALSTHLESDGADVAWQANITMADDTWIGLSGATARITFDDTPAGDNIRFENCTHVGIDNLLEHNGDLDTYLIFSPDYAGFRIGNVDMLQMQELAAAQDNVTINATGADVDFVVEAVGTANALLVQGSDGKVGINTAAIPHGAVGYAMLALDGADTSANGPHVQFTTASDDYPLLQILPYAHDSVNISFDSYLAAGGWLSSDAGSNFQIIKAGDLLQFRYDSGIAQGAVVAWNLGIVLTATGGVGIETGAVPHGGIGYAKFAIDGLDVSALGPHVQFTTTADDYPLLQILPYGHDNININFDSYLAAGGWLSSDVGSNFQIIKTSDLLQFRYDSGIAQGAVLTWNLGLAMAVTGNVGIADGAPTEGRLSIINNVADNGAIAYLYRNQGTVNQSGFYMHLDNVADDEAAMTIRHDGTGDLLQLFDGAVQVVDVDNTGHVLLNSTTGLTGHTLQVHRALASGSTDNAVVFFTNTAAGDDQSVLWITQYAPAIALDVTIFAANHAAYFQRDVDAAVHPVVTVVQDHATAATPVVAFQQDDISEGVINFIASDRGVITGATNSVASVRAELGGVVYRLALYVDA